MKQLKRQVKDMQSLQAVREQCDLNTEEKDVIAGRQA
jgi:hypothetical protein